jgi:hypothetical protein
VNHIKIRPVDFDNEEELKKGLKKACPPVQPSALFERHMAYELSLKSETRTRDISIWNRPVLWVSLGLACSISLIVCGIISVPQGNSVVYTGAAYSEESSSSNFQPDLSDRTYQYYIV